MSWLATTGGLTSWLICNFEAGLSSVIKKVPVWLGLPVWHVSSMATIAFCVIALYIVILVFFEMTEDSSMHDADSAGGIGGGDGLNTSNGGIDPSLTNATNSVISEKSRKSPASGWDSDEEGGNKSRRYDKLISYDGSTMSFEEFWFRWMAWTRSRAIPVERQPDLLVTKCTGPPFETLSSLPRSSSAQDTMASYEAKLREVYGLTAERAFEELQRLGSSHSWRSVDELATKLANLSKAAFKGLSEQSLSIVGAGFLWFILGKTVNKTTVDHLRSLWQRKTLEDATKLCRALRPLIEEDVAAAVFSKGHPVHKTISKERQCYNCRGYNHIAASCPSPGKGNAKGKGGKGKGKGKGKGYHKEVSLCNNIMLFDWNGLFAMIDPGCSRTLFSPLGLARLIEKGKAKTNISDDIVSKNVLWPLLLAVFILVVSR